MLDIEEEEGDQSVPAGLVALQVGGEADCGLGPAGTVLCWGPSGPLLRGLPAGEQDIAALSVGFRHACALRKDGGLSCWGDGSAPDGGAPFQAVPPPWPVSAVAVGMGTHSCALRLDGSVSCWGGDGSGDGGKVFAGQLRAPPGTFVALSAGHDHTCALRADGSVACWGQVQDPPQEWRFSQISSGAFHACGVTIEGGLRCWGGDQFGQVKETPAGG